MVFDLAGEYIYIIHNDTHDNWYVIIALFAENSLIAGCICARAGGVQKCFWNCIYFVFVVLTITLMVRCLRFVLCVCDGILNYRWIVGLRICEICVEIYITQMGIFKSKQHTSTKGVR